MKAAIFVCITLVLVLLNAGCTQQTQDPGTGKTATSSGATDAGGKTVDIQGFAFNPAELRIKSGETVVWTNRDSTPHTVSSDTGDELSSGTLSGESAYSHTFNTAGEYAYHCAIHTGMKGKIIVE
jgi:amicyanin